MRDLTPTRDGIKIYSSNGNPIASTLEGLLRINMSGRTYVQSVETVTALNVFDSTTPKDVSEVSVYSYGVHNTGAEGAIVQLQISPDGVTWTADNLECEILPGSLAVFTPNHFLRYVRLSYRSQSSNVLVVWFQGQV